LAGFAVWNRSLWASRYDWRRIALAFPCAGLLLATLLPPAWVGYVLAERRMSVPLLLTFEKSWELSLYYMTDPSAVVETPENWPGPAGHAGMLVLDGPDDAVLNFHDPYPDWSQYESLSFVAMSVTGDPVTLNLRIHDRSHSYAYDDRFNHPVEIGMVPLRYKIDLRDVHNAPKDRKMDLAAIDSLILFVSNPASGHRILMDDFRLH